MREKKYKKRSGLDSLDQENKKLYLKDERDLQKIRIDFIQERNKILRSQLPLNEETEEFNNLVENYKQQFSKIFEGSGKLIGISCRKPSKKELDNPLHELAPLYLFLGKSDSKSQWGICKICGLRFFRGDHYRRQYCNILCLQEARRKQAAIRMKKYRNKHRIGKKGSSKYTKKCKICGGEFRSIRNDAKTCSGACRMKKSRLKRPHHD